MKDLFSRRLPACAGLGLLLAAFAAVPAQASVNTAPCSEPALTHAFQAFGDPNSYFLAGGETENNFSGAGWTLSGGAKLLEVTLQNGDAGQVLDLPSGARAVSPIVCVTSEDPVARAIVRDVSGSQGVFFYVEYEGTNTWGKPKNTGQIHGNKTEWTAVTPVNLQPENTSGWQPMRITLEAGGNTSEFQLYNLYLDPRMTH